MTFAHRIAKLETKLSREGVIKIVVVLEGESNADALTRVGLPANVRGVVFISALDVDI